MTTPSPGWGQLATFWLKTSRPGLYFQWLWLYLVPLGGESSLSQTTFWVGLIYVTLPLNLLVYGWNDAVDADLDRLNPRKDSFLFGACGSAAERRTLPWAIVLTNLPFWIYFVIDSGGPMLAGVLLVNGAYNLPRHGLRGKPPWELLNELGVLLVVLLSVLLNDAPQPSWGVYVYLYLFVVHAHLVGEVMDYEPDKEGGRRTTAGVLGRRLTKIIIILLVAAEGVVLGWVFGDWILAAMLGLGALWLLADLLIFFRNRNYSVREMYLFGWAMNAAGYGSMLWVWLNGTFAAAVP